MYKKFWKNTGGNFALIAALVAPMLMGVGGISVDYFMYYKQVDTLQNAADAAALASVRELSLAGNTAAKSSQLQEISKSYVYSSFYQDREIKNPESEMIIETTPDSKNGEVSVEVSYRWAPIFAQLFDKKVTPIKVSSTAKLAGDSLTCVIGLMQPQPQAKSSIHLDNESALLAEGCTVYSNSTSRYGLRADKSAAMKAQSICTAGGVITFGRAYFTPSPIRDCPKIEDPLASRAAPIVSSCMEQDLEITGDTVLKPGVYCGGLTVSGNSIAELDPGVYIIKDGPLIVKDNATLTSKGVNFFLTGDNSTFHFEKDTTIDLAALDSGAMAGLLFFEDRNVSHSFDFNPFDLNNLPPEVRLNTISSNNARNLLGTIYLSKSIFLIDSDAPVADASAYTAIITGRLWLQKGPTLTLNADYSKTTVPVPNGLIGTKPILVK